MCQVFYQGLERQRQKDINSFCPCEADGWVGVETDKQKIARSVNWNSHGRKQSVLRGQIGPAGSRNHPCVASIRETSLGFLALTLLLGILGLEASTFTCSSKNDHCGSYLRQLLRDFSVYQDPGRFYLFSMCVYTQQIYFAMPFERKLQTSLNFSMPLLRIGFVFN